jgi:hypothetical protein
MLDKWAIMGRCGDLRRACRREPDSREVRDHQATHYMDMVLQLANYNTLLKSFKPRERLEDEKNSKEGMKPKAGKNIA